MEEFGTVIGKKNKFIVVRNDNNNEILKLKNTINADISDNIIINKEKIVRSKWCIIFYFIPLLTMLIGFFVGMLFKNELFQYLLMATSLFLGLVILFFIDTFILKQEFKYTIKIKEKDIK